MLGDPGELSARQAAELLDDVGRLRRRARRALGMPWFPLLCFGALTILSAPLIAASGTAALLPLWIVAGGAGMLLTGRHYRRRAHRRGVTGGGRRTWLTAAVMFAACLAAGVAGGVLGGAAAGLLVPVVLVFAGYVVVGWLQRSCIPPLAIAPAAAVAAGLAAAGVSLWVVELVFGIGLVTAGAGLHAAGGRL